MKIISMGKYDFYIEKHNSGMSCSWVITFRCWNKDIWGEIKQLKRRKK